MNENELEALEALPGDWKAYVLEGVIRFLESDSLLRESEADNYSYPIPTPEQKVILDEIEEMNRAHKEQVIKEIQQLESLLDQVNHSRLVWRLPAGMTLVMIPKPK